MRTSRSDGNFKSWKTVIPPERFIDEYQSHNERLADLMRRLRICEEKGSGIDKVLQTVEVYQLPAPDFRLGRALANIWENICIQKQPEDRSVLEETYEARLNFPLSRSELNRQRLISHPEI